MIFRSVVNFLYLKMTCDLTTSLRIEPSINYSGKIYHFGRIPHLKERNYYVDKETELDGDAPKEFIHAYFYEEGGKVRKAKPRTWEKYIAKSAEKWYPHESVIEYLINRIGQELGLRMNEVKLVVANQRIRFLSKYFLGKDEIMVHGAEICGEYLEDNVMARNIAEDKKTARELFNFEFLSDAIFSIFKANGEQLLHDLVKVIVFDAIVGNNDRHFYNWSVIRSIRKRVTDTYFAPIYDSARGLAWNWSDANVIKHYNNHFSGGKRVEKYIHSACPRISIEGNSDINHFDLVAYVSAKSPAYKETISSFITSEKEGNVIDLYNREFSHFFIKERNDLVKLILHKRFGLLREAIRD